jgi:S-adenosylmethionine-dependent methyltransferase
VEKLLSSPDCDRFLTEAGKYAAYLETPEGRLRLDLAFVNVRDFFPKTRTLRALDIGGGTGALAVRLARLGAQVTVFDVSAAMLEVAGRAAQQAGMGESISLQQGDASQLARRFSAESFDLILCHNLLEFVDNPGSVLRQAAGLMRDSSSVMSVLVRSQAGEVLKAALVNGDLAASDRNLTAEWGEESLYQGKVRVFTAEAVKSMLSASSLALRAEFGVRILSDYLPPKISREDDYGRIFDLERKLGRRSEFAAVARYTQWIAQPAGGSMKDNR